MKFIDLFAGIGGFHYVLHDIGGECVFASEINEHARKTYQENFQAISPNLFQDNRFAGDVTCVNYGLIPDFDILCAGFPCQPFSICGHRKGFEDTRGTLFFNICEIIEEKKPEILFLENVKYLVHHDNGKTLSTIIASLESLGYYVSYKLMNAVNFGVPQNRERLIIIGSRKRKFDFNKIKFSLEKKQLKKFLDTTGPFEILDKNEYTLLDNPTVQKQSGLIFAGYRNKNIWKKGIRPNTTHLSRVHRQPNRIYSVEGTHPTLPSQESSGRFFIYDTSNNYVRKMTLRECYRIMGFPDGFVINPIKGEAYKQIGNSICIPMMKRIAVEIQNQLIGTYNDKNSCGNFKRTFQQQELFAEAAI